MAESISAVDSALWRIAELGARCGQRSIGVDHRPMWEELERIIADIGEELTAARHGAPIAPPELRRLRKQLKAAIEESDAERARAEELLADAETARRERDRMGQKATAQAQAARATDRGWRTRLETAVAEQADATARLEVAAARVLALEAAVEAALVDRDAAVAAREASLAEFETTVNCLAARAAGEMISLPAV